VRRRRVDWSHWDGQVMDYRIRVQQGESKNKGETMYRIRHTSSGLYLHVGMVADKSGGLKVELQMCPAELASAFPRSAAEHIAAAWIAITRDHSTEIEEA
jgi:hypothetical protein